MLVRPPDGINRGESQFPEHSIVKTPKFSLKEKIASLFNQSHKKLVEEVTPESLMLEAKNTVKSDLYAALNDIRKNVDELSKFLQQPGLTKEQITASRALLEDHLTRARNLETNIEGVAHFITDASHLRKTQQELLARIDTVFKEIILTHLDTKVDFHHQTTQIIKKYDQVRDLNNALKPPLDVTKIQQIYTLRHEIEAFIKNFNKELTTPIIRENFEEFQAVYNQSKIPDEDVLVASYLENPPTEVREAYENYQEAIGANYPIPKHLKLPLLLALQDPKFRSAFQEGIDIAVRVQSGEETSPSKINAAFANLQSLYFKNAPESLQGIDFTSLGYILSLKSGYHFNTQFITDPMDFALVTDPEQRGSVADKEGLRALSRLSVLHAEPGDQEALQAMEYLPNKQLNCWERSSWMLDKDTLIWEGGIAIPGQTPKTAHAEFDLTGIEDKDKTAALDFMKYLLRSVPYDEKLTTGPIPTKYQSLFKDEKDRTQFVEKVEELRAAMDAGMKRAYLAIGN